MAKKTNEIERIIIDPEKGLKFTDEDQLFDHFQHEIQTLEQDYNAVKLLDDVPEEEHSKYEHQLEETLEHPDEIWLDKTSLKDKEVFIFLKEFSDESERSLFHIALTYAVKGIPSFVYLHFPTKKIEMVEKYQRGEITYDRILEEAPKGALEGDALLEGDELALGFYHAMLKVRSEEDIPEEKFRDYSQFRESAIEEADEIWRHNDPFGNALVNFIKEFHEENMPIFTYVVVTLEDINSNSHALLFSFPTIDAHLISRYRQGENMQAESISQESSH